MIIRILIFAFLAAILFGGAASCYEQLTLHWLSTLPASAKEEMESGSVPEILKRYQGQEISFRGFIYQGKDGRIMLATEPDLKSCCIGSKGSITRQVMLIGDNIAFAKDGKVREVLGRFEIEPLKDKNGNLEKMFVLYDTRIIEQDSKSNILIYLIYSALFIFLLFPFGRIMLG